MAAAGLAVSLLTQSVREVVISGTGRQRDIQTWKEEEEVTEKKSGHQHISRSFIRALFCDDSILCELLDVRMSPTPLPEAQKHSDESKFRNAVLTVEMSTLHWTV